MKFMFVKEQSLVRKKLLILMVEFFMHYDYYVGGFSYSEPEGHPVPSASDLAVGSASNERSQSGAVAPLSMSQQMLMLCFISGQIEHSDWVRHIEEDPVLAAHFSLMWSART